MLWLLVAGLSPNKTPGIGHEMKGFFLSSVNLSDSKGGSAWERRERGQREREFKATIIVNK